MTAKFSTPAIDLADARAKAQDAFAAFFGDHPFEIVEEISFAEYATVEGKVVFWACHFEAVAA